MNSVTGVKHWQTFGATVTGSRHLRDGLPNQDALCQGELWGREGVFAAVSDGHGSKTCFRSDYGAQRAVGLVRDLLSSPGALRSLASEGGMAEMAARLVAQWREEMLRHLKQNPFTAAEVEGLDRQQRTVLGRNALVAYGATLLTAVAANDVFILMQLGDGDFLLLTENGAVSAAFDPDARHLGNATTSLCLPDAPSLFRCRLWRTDLPHMVLASTDGYGNSFRTEADFHKTLKDYAALIGAHGWRSVSEKLPEWLSDTSQRGSGDDISVALLFRP